MKFEDIVVVDVETSGPDVFENDLLSVYMISVESAASIEVYLKHENEIRWGAVGKRYFNKYRKEWEEKSEDAHDALVKIVEYLDTRPSSQVIFSGHNVAFDYYFIKQAARKYGVELPRKLSHRLLDTHSIIAMKVTQGLLPKYTLKPHGAADYFGIPIHSRHSAKYDALLSKEILLNLFHSPEHKHFVISESSNVDANK